MTTKSVGPYPFPSVAVPARHFVALTAVVIVFLAHRAVDTVIDEGGLFLLLGIVVLGSAWFAGTGSALSVTVLGAVIGSLVSGPRTAAVETHLALFVGQGLLLTALVAELRRLRRAADREASLAVAAHVESEAASRMKDEFLGTISHELRTPLNAVLGWVHLIKTGKLDRQTERRGFESIERNVRLQAQLTGDLLDVSKALTGRLQLDQRTVSLKTVLSEAVSQVSAAAAAKDVTLDVGMGPSPVVVRGDPTRLRQVAWQLLANAIKFTPQGGRVQAALESNGHAQLTVRDTGPGIDDEFLPRIFERFSQADASPTRATGGLGVGLSLVRELVERHGGEIKVSNDAGGGAVFTVRLPLHYADQHEATVAPAVMSPTGGSPRLDGLRVLLLDRDPETRELLTIVLRQRGADVCPASSIDEALEALESWGPDVLISDATSPEHDAYAVVGRVHSLGTKGGGRIPAVALTTRARTDDSMRRMLADVRRDLPKPVEPAILAAEIARLAGRERRAAER